MGFQELDLLSELLDDPGKFDSQGKAHELLQEYFSGKPIETLRPLLTHDNVCARRSGAFILSELGTEGSDLILDVVPLISDSDLHIQWYAIESVMACSTSSNFGQFINIVRELENPNSSICRLAMRLVSNANQSQIEAGIRSIETLHAHHDIHKRGLQLLLNRQTVGTVDIIAALTTHDDLLQKYGAIAAKRCMSQSPELIQRATRSEDEFVSRFAQEALEDGDT